MYAVAHARGDSVRSIPRERTFPTLISPSGTWDLLHGSIPNRANRSSRDERAPLHSITSSALACNEGAKVNPNSMTVLRLMVKLPQAGTNLSAAPFMQ